MYSTARARPPRGRLEHPFYLLRCLLTRCLVPGSVAAILWEPPTDTGHAWLLAITLGLIISARSDALLLCVVPAVLTTPAPLAARQGCRARKRARIRYAGI